MAGSPQELKQTWIKSRNILFSPVFTFGRQWPTEALRRKPHGFLCCAHWQIRQKEGALKLFYLQITHLFNNYITNYVSLFIFKATPLLKGSRKQGLTCLSTTWSKKSRISWMETQSISCWKWSHMSGKATITDSEMETSCWIIIPPPRKDSSVTWLYILSNLPLCNEPTYLPRLTKKAEFHRTQTRQHWLRNGYGQWCNVDGTNPVPKAISSAAFTALL